LLAGKFILKNELHVQRGNNDNPAYGGKVYIPCPFSFKVIIDNKLNQDSLKEINLGNMIGTAHLQNQQ
jgi:hypothetical protein